MARRRPFGNARQTGSGRWQARFHLPAKAFAELRRRHPNLTQRNYTAPWMFDTEDAARDWLNQQRADIQREKWTPPVDPADAPKPLLLRDFARTVIEERDLSPRSREHAEDILTRFIDPVLGNLPVTEVAPAAVSTWYAKLLRNPDRPTMRAHAYATLRMVMQTAVNHEIIDRNPCRIKGAGQSSTQSERRVATLEELAKIDANLPDRYKMMVQLATWCVLRFGEVTELRRSDVDLTGGLVHIRRGVTRTKAGAIVRAPKTRKSRRPVDVPAHLLDDLKSHLHEHAQPGHDGLLFPGPDGKSHIRPSQMQRWWYPARAAAGRPDLRFHDLRHTGNTYMVAAGGANVREIMDINGWTSERMAIRYVQSIEGRRREIADRLSAFATGGQPRT